MLPSSDEDWARPITVNPGNLTTPIRMTTLAPLTQSTTPNTISGNQQYWGHAIGMRNDHPSYMEYAPPAVYAATTAKIPFGMTSSATSTMSQQRREESPNPFAFNLPPETPPQHHQTWSWVPSNTAYPNPTHPPVAHPPSFASTASTEAYAYPQYGNPLNVSPMSYHQRLQLVPPEIRSNTASTMDSRSSSEMISACQGTPGYAVYSPPNRVAIAAPSSLAYESSTSFTTTQTPLTTSQSSSQFVTSPVTRSVKSANDSLPDIEMSGNEASRRPPIDTKETAKSSTTSPKKRRSDTKTGPNFLTKLYDMLADPAYQHLLHWDREGRQIIIQDAKALEAHVLPLVFKQSKFASFSRQLNIYGFMRKLSVRQGETSRETDVSVWTHYELDRSSAIQQLMTYKRRVGPRNYSRKTTGKPPLPVLGKGARYEFIDEPTPDPAPEPLHSPLQPMTAVASRPVRAKIPKMSAGTLPMPSPRSGTTMYPSPRSTPYDPAPAKSAPIDRVPAEEGGETRPRIPRAPSEGFWKQMLGAASQQEKIYGAEAGCVSGSPAPAGYPAEPCDAEWQTGMPSGDLTAAAPVRSVQRQTHPYCPVPLVQLESRAQLPITYVAGRYPAFPLPSITQRGISDRPDSSFTTLEAPVRRASGDKTPAREPLGIDGVSIDSSRISIASLGGIGAGEKKMPAPMLERKRDSFSPGEAHVDVRTPTTMHAPSLHHSSGPSEAGNEREERDVVIVQVEPLVRHSSVAGTARDMVVKVEECDEPECW